MFRPAHLAVVACVLVAPAAGADFPRFEAQTIDPHIGNVCYAVTVADVNADGRPDAVAVAEDAVHWYASPSWKKHTIIKDATERDNVCIQPRDVDGDGRVDFALGASWQPSNTRSGGTVQWLQRSEPTGERPWRVLAIGAEPTVHRMRWGDLLGTGKPQLVVAPLQGRGTKGPDWGAGQPVRFLVYSVPADPARDDWPVERVETGLHTTHNLQVVRPGGGTGAESLLVAAWEGVFLFERQPDGQWDRTQVGTGDQASRPFRGASEVKLGSLRSGRYVATIEPWHGHQVVVYTPAAGQALGNVDGRLWTRRVIDQPVQWGHAVWCADLDLDGDDELIVGQRDRSSDPARAPRGPGVLVYDPKPGSTPVEFERHTIDDGGIGCEDLLAADLDGDGRPDLLAGGRSTHDVRIYWNRAR